MEGDKDEYLLTFSTRGLYLLYVGFNISKIRQDLSFPTLAAKKISRPSGGGGGGVCPKKKNLLNSWIPIEVLDHAVSQKKTFEFLDSDLKV